MTGFGKQDELSIGSHESGRRVEMMNHFLAKWADGGYHLHQNAFSQISIEVEVDQTWPDLKQAK